MGLGGHLLWSSVFRTLNEATGQPVIVGHTPLVSDLLAGRLYKGDDSLVNNPIFRHNPRLEFPPCQAKRRWQIVLDRGFAALLRRCGLGGAYERAIVALSRAYARAAGQHRVCIDMHLHSYVKRETPGRLEWKSGGHIIDIILNQYRIPAIDHQCEMYFTGYIRVSQLTNCANKAVS